GEPLEPLRDEDDRDGQAERGEREVDAGEAERRQSEGEAEEARDDARDRDRPVLADAVVGREDRRRVGAEREEGSVPERDLAVVAREDVQADDRDEVDADEREPVVQEVVEGVREQDDERRDRRDRGRPDGDAGEPRRQTRLTTTRPKRPAGRTASATGSCSSVPMNRAYALSRLIPIPITNAPTTEPTGLSMPPSTAAANA